MKINTEINTPGVTPSPTCDNAREMLVVAVRVIHRCRFRRSEMR